MSKVFINESTLSAIGSAIRQKTGKEALIPTGNMAEEINSIESIAGLEKAEEVGF